MSNTSHRWIVVSTALAAALFISACAAVQMPPSDATEAPITFTAFAKAPPDTAAEYAQYAESLASLAMESPSSAAAGRLEIHFVNVGQGDCTLIKCPNGRVVMVDAGSLSSDNAQRVEDVRTYISDNLGQSDPTVDYLVITHPDTDHYNMIPRVLHGVQVGQIYRVGQLDQHGGEAFDSNGDFDWGHLKSWLQSIDSGRRKILRRGHRDGLGDPSDLFGPGDAEFYVLAAKVDDTTVNSEKNTWSIVLLVSYGDFDVLLTGDATFDTENYIIDKNPDWWLDVEVLKIGHHGSSTTST